MKKQTGGSNKLKSFIKDLDIKGPFADSLKKFVPDNITFRPMGDSVAIFQNGLPGNWWENLTPNNSVKVPINKYNKAKEFTESYFNMRPSKQDGGSLKYPYFSPKVLQQMAHSPRRTDSPGIREYLQMKGEQDMRKAAYRHAPGSTYDPTDQWAMEAIYATAPIPFLGKALGKGASAWERNLLRKSELGEKMGTAGDLHEIGMWNPNQELAYPETKGWFGEQDVPHGVKLSGSKDQALHDWYNTQRINAVHGKQELLRDLPEAQQYVQYDPAMTGQVAARGPMRSRPGFTNSETGRTPFDLPYERAVVDKPGPFTPSRKRMESSMTDPAAKMNPKGLNYPHSMFSYDYLPHKTGGDIKVDPRGYWNPENRGKPVRIPSDSITMRQVNHPVYGVPDNGAPRMMQPGRDYSFPGASYVDEFPMMQKHAEGGELIPDQPIASINGTLTPEMMSRDRNYVMRPPVTQNTSVIPLDRQFKQEGKNYYMRYPNTQSGQTDWRAITPQSYKLGMKNQPMISRYQQGGTGDHLNMIPMNLGGMNNTAIGYNMQTGGKPDFDSWYKTVNSDFNDTTAYNLRESYNELPYRTMEDWRSDPEKNHLPDTYKLPNHPTFSNESKYYKPGMRAVKWVNGKAVPIENKQQRGAAGNTTKPFEENTPLNIKNDFINWLKQTSLDKIHSEMSENPLGLPQEYLDEMKKGGGFKLNPDHAGWCSPMTKATCTGKRRQFAINAKNHFKEDGGQSDPFNGFTGGSGWLAQYGGFDNREWAGQRSYKQINYNPGQPMRAPLGPYQTDNQSQTFRQSLGLPEGTDMSWNSPQGQQSALFDDQSHNTPMWTNQDLQTRNKALGMTLGNLQQNQITNPLDRNAQVTDINNTNLINSAKPENFPTVSKKTVRPPWMDRWWANPDIINAGMETVTGVANSIDARKKEKWLRKQTAADAWNQSYAGGRGDYTQNYGYFRPDQTVPVQYTYQDGGQFQEGGEYDLDDSTIQELIKQGYQISLV